MGMFIKRDGMGEAMMSKLHQEHVKTYFINKKRVELDLCWTGDKPEDDDDRFYDLYDADGRCLNEGSPFHDDGDGVPSQKVIAEYLGGER